MKKELTIEDIEKRLGVRRTTYFYWEKVGKVPKARRTRMGGYRVWTEAEFKKLERIVKGA